MVHLVLLATCGSTDCHRNEIAVVFSCNLLRDEMIMPITNVIQQLRYRMIHWGCLEQVQTVAIFNRCTPFHELVYCIVMYSKTKVIAWEE